MASCAPPSSFDTGASVADPFFRTAGLVALLEVQAKQERHRRPARVPALGPRVNLRAA